MRQPMAFGPAISPVAQAECSDNSALAERPPALQRFGEPRPIAVDCAGLQPDAAASHSNADEDFLAVHPEANQPHDEQDHHMFDDREIHHRDVWRMDEFVIENNRNPLENVVA